MKQKYEKKHIFFLALVICAACIIVVGSLNKKSGRIPVGQSNMMTEEEAKNGKTADAPVQESIQVLSVDGRQIFMTEVDVRMYQLRDYYTDIYGESPWARVLDDGRTVSETAKDEMYQSLIRTQLLCNKAADYDVGLSEAELQSCAKEAKDYIDALGPEICGSFHLTFDGALAVTQKQLLAAKVYEKVLSELGSDAGTSEEIGEEQVKKFEVLYEQWLKDCTITEMPAWQNVVIGSVG